MFHPGKNCMYAWLYVFHGAHVLDGDVICEDHDLNRCSGW